VKLEKIRKLGVRESSLERERERETARREIERR
jgi:hypothetical protein